MPKLSSRLGHIAAEVKDFVDARWTPAYLRQVGNGIARVLFPEHGRQGAGMDAQAWQAIRFLESEGCDMCARPFEGGLHFGAGAHCQACEQKPFPFSRTRAACLYGDASRETILAFKHGDRLDLAPMLVRWLERSAHELIADCHAIVPVPLHPSRLLERRYNQAAELARPLAARSGRRFLPDSLVRTRPTPRQGASADARWANVRSAFAVARSGIGKVTGQRILLIDDVMTTGATARACARVLLEAGASAVDIAVLARAVPESAV